MDIENAFQFPHTRNQMMCAWVLGFFCRYGLVTGTAYVVVMKLFITGIDTVAMADDYYGLCIQRAGRDLVTALRAQTVC